jgi:hypothetical protein
MLPSRRARPTTPTTVYASSTARTAFSGIPNQSFVGPASRSKSREDNGPFARIPSSTRSATVTFSARAAAWNRRPFRPELERNQKLAHRDERQRFVGRLEDLAVFVQLVAPIGLVVGDTRVQHEVVVPAGDRDRVELDRPEPPEDLEHAVEARERPRRRKEVPRDEKATRRLGRDLHQEDNCGSRS